MRTAIIVVNYRTPWHLNKCLKSIFKHTHDFHLHLVHNNPDDKSVEVGEWFKSKYPEQITVYINDENLGFVGGVNTPFLDVIKYERICLLNSDTIVKANWLQQMSDEMDANPQISQICPDSNSFYSDNLFWKLIRVLPWNLNRLQIIQNTFGLAPSAVEKRGFKPADSFFDFCGGFCTLFNSKHFLDLGYILDPQIIHGYWDDLDLSCYLRQFGQIGSTHKAYVFHFLGASFRILKKDSSSFDKDMMKRINALYVMHKWRDYFRSEISKLTTETLVAMSGNSYLASIINYFGVRALKPDVGDYLKTEPAKLFWDKVRS